MLSDEERKAIEGLFHLAHINTYLDLEKEDVVKISRVIIKQWKDETKIVLNLIEKQSKEIEQIKDEYNTKLLSNAGIYQLGFTDGQKSVEAKIKAKIEEIDENGYWEFLEKRDEDKCKDILQSLLEKE